MAPLDPTWPFLGQNSRAATSSCSHPPSVWAQLDALREALLQTQQQVVAQQQEIQLLKAQLKGGASGTGGALVSAAEVVRPNPTGTNANLLDVAPVTQNNDTNAPSPSADPQAQQAGQNARPSSIKLGDAVLTPGGFVDFENIFRTTNTQSNIATDFAGIPFSNTALGRVSELRTTAQFSRLSVKVEDNFKGVDIIGYVEGDFSGNSAAS